jgi:hypothetical protein
VSGIPNWDDLTEVEREKILRGEILDIDGIGYKMDCKSIECDVTVNRNDGTIEKY